MARCHAGGRVMPILIWVATLACMMEMFSGPKYPAKEQVKAKNDLKKQ
jgi:hypothetical protein